MDNFAEVATNSSGSTNGTYIDPIAPLNVTSGLDEDHLGSVQPISGSEWAPFLIFLGVAFGILSFVGSIYYLVWRYCKLAELRENVKLSSYSQQNADLEVIKGLE
jgi:hypothetical protein